MNIDNKNNNVNNDCTGYNIIFIIKIIIIIMSVIIIIIL